LAFRHLPAVRPGSDPRGFVRRFFEAGVHPLDLEPILMSFGRAARLFEVGSILGVGDLLLAGAGQSHSARALAISSGLVPRGDSTRSHSCQRHSAARRRSSLLFPLSYSCSTRSIALHIGHQNRKPSTI
jgi:hypothetical protein